MAKKHINLTCEIYNDPDADYEGREIRYVAVPGEGLVTIDVTEKTSPKMISRHRYAYEKYAHQGAPTQDRRYFVMGDEGDERFTLPQPYPRLIVIDISDLDNLSTAGEYFGYEEAVDHDLHIRGDFIYWSVYRAGFRILRFTDPQTIDEVAFFDTYPAETTPAGGSWSNYPLLPSGIILVSSTREGLFVLRWPSSTTAADRPDGRSASLSQLYPNPASRRISAQFSVDRAQTVRFRLVTATGRQATFLHATHVPAGTPVRVDLPLPDLAAGGYLLVMEYDGGRTVRPLLIIK